jgi:hypothetical protein
LGEAIAQFSDSKTIAAFASQFPEGVIACRLNTRQLSM